MNEDVATAPEEYAAAENVRVGETPGVLVDLRRPLRGKQDGVFARGISPVAASARACRICS